MYQSIPGLTIPPGQLFDGQILHPREKRVQNPHPQAYKNELKPNPRGHYPQLFTIKTWKKWYRSHVKLHDFIIFRWLKDKLGLQLRPRLHQVKFTLINCKTVWIFVCISLIR